MDKQRIYNEIVEFLKSKGATKIAVFGSYVRNEETPKSDIDVFVDFPIGEMNLFDFVGIEQELSDKIGIKVDLGMELKPYIKKYVEDEIVYLLK